MFAGAQRRGTYCIRGPMYIGAQSPAHAKWLLVFVITSLLYDAIAFPLPSLPCHPFFLCVALHTVGCPPRRCRGVRLQLGASLHGRVATPPRVTPPHPLRQVPAPPVPPYHVSGVPLCASYHVSKQALDALQ